VWLAELEPAAVLAALESPDVPASRQARPWLYTQLRLRFVFACRVSFDFAPWLDLRDIDGLSTKLDIFALVPPAGGSLSKASNSRYIWPSPRKPRGRFRDQFALGALRLAVVSPLLIGRGLFDAYFAALSHLADRIQIRWFCAIPFVRSLFVACFRMSRLGPLPAFIGLYAAMYAAFGAASPFWPRFFEVRGLTPEELGILFGLGTAMRLIAGPLANRIADIFGALRAILAVCIVTAVAAALGLIGAQGFWLLLTIQLVQSAALAPITTLADALALRASVQPPGFEYGWVRGAASAAFIAATLVSGQVLNYFELSAIVWIHATLLAGALFGALLVPEADTRVERAGDPVGQSMIGGVRELLRLAAFRRVIVVAALVYGSHAMHDTFSVIRWTAAGVGTVASSLLWSEAVAAEVVVFVLVGPALLRRLGVAGAATLAAGAAIVRWVVEAETAAIWMLGFVQPLHGLTFALMHLVCMRMIANSVPAHLAATAQALYAVGPGLATASLVVVSGQLYEAFGPHGFLVMAALCIFSLPLAIRLRD
jgi:PPP family 3-phenylpropionic acid transporter